MNVKNINIRETLPHELPALAELRWALCRENGETEPTVEKKHFTGQFSKQVQKLATAGNLINFVAVYEKNLTGVISLFLVNKIPSPDDIIGCWGYVTNVYVKPEYRNIGIGKKLLNSVKDHADKNGYELLVVWPSERSYPFYQREGFTSEGREQDPLVLVL